MIKLQIQTHSLCFTCTHELQNRKKESLSLQLLSSYKPCNDKQQNDQKFSAIQPQRTLRVVFLFIDQLLLTTESNHIDISHMSTMTIRSEHSKVAAEFDRTIVQWDDIICVPK